MPSLSGSRRAPRREQKGLHAASCLAILTLPVLLLTAPSARAQADCGDWQSTFAAPGADDPILDWAVFDDGPGPTLYAAGFFTSIGDLNVSGVARWNGQAWSALGAPVATDGAVLALGSYDSGSGAQLHAGGEFTRIGGTDASNIARWNGTSWSPLGAGLDGLADAIAVFDSGAGPELVVGGTFTMADGVPAANIARWNGTSWSALGLGTSSRVRDLIVHDDGTGPALYACGWFASAGGVDVPRVARWNGSTWSAVGSSTQYVGFQQMNDLEVYDTGSGPELYMCGYADLGNGLQSVVRWDGASWTAVGALPSGFAEALTVFHDGDYPALHAAFRDLNSSPSRTTIHAWDGFQWTALAGEFAGREGHVRSMAAFDGEADGVPAANLASWRSCGTVGTVACPGDGSNAACPCGNTGASGHGCANSAFAGGAVLSSNGLASLGSDTLQLVAAGMSGTSALFFQGTAQLGGGGGIMLDDGLWCAGGALVRLRTAPVSGGSASVPLAGDPRLSVSGLILGPSEIRTYQVRYRNAASFCTPGTTNFTNGLRIVWSL